LNALINAVKATNYEGAMNDTSLIKLINLLKSSCKL